MTDDISSLIDHQAIQEFEHGHAMAVRRMVSTQAELSKAQAAHGVARDAANAAIGDGHAAALEAETALSHAGTVLKVAEKIAASAATEVQISGSERRAAVHRRAFAAVAHVAFSRRVAAVRRAESLMASLRETAEDYRSADLMLSSVNAELGPFPSELQIGQQLLNEHGTPRFTAATHESRLRAGRVDPETGKADWLGD